MSIPIAADGKPTDVVDPTRLAWAQLAKADRYRNTIDAASELVDLYNAKDEEDVSPIALLDNSAYSSHGSYDARRSIDFVQTRLEETLSSMPLEQNETELEKWRKGDWANLFSSRSALPRVSPGWLECRVVLAQIFRAAAVVCTLQWAFLLSNTCSLTDFLSFSASYFAKLVTQSRLQLNKSREWSWMVLCTGLARAIYAVRMSLCSSRVSRPADDD